jgi:hypothetical protein
VKDCETKWRSRFTVRLTIPESSNALATFSKILKGLFTEMQATCENEEKVFILPWADKDLKTVDAIDTADDVPTVFSKFRPFITKFFPGNGSEPHICYFKLHIGHDRDLCDLQADMKYWLMSGSHGMYFESLQCENSVFIGWLLWSLKSMDADALKEDILQMTGVEVGLRWMAIDTGAKGKVEKKDKIFALHLEVASKDRRKAKKFFLELYGKSNNNPAELPLYLRLRFITPNSEATSTNTITKLKRFRERQKEFLKKIGTSTTASIVHLDWRINDKLTLRDMIMEIKSSVYENTPVFFAIDQDWTKTNFIVSYLPVMREEAVHTLHTLIPQLRHTIGLQRAAGFDALTESELHGFFTDEAVEDTAEMYFDTTLGRVVDPLTDANLEIVDNENLLGDEGGDDDVFLARPALQQLQTGVFPGNSGDSISTLGHSLATGILSPEQQSRARARRVARSTASISSTSTGVSVEAFTDLKRNVTSIQSTLERLATFMESSNAPTSSTASTAKISFTPADDNSSPGAGSL